MKIEHIWGLLRLSVGWTFLWAFLDKSFGLGFSTCRDVKTDVISTLCDAAWINGGSPTYGFLTYATKGPLKEFFGAMATSGLVEWLFMLGILFVGVTLLFGIAVRLGSVVGIMLYVLFYVSGSIWPEHNPFLDEHIVYIIIMAGFLLTRPGRTFGLGKWWEETALVRRYPILS